MNLQQMNTYVLSKQHLTDQTKTNDVLQITKDLIGLHATNSTTPYLSLHARTRNFQRQTLDNELYVKRNLGKIRFVRKTVHIVPKDTIPTAYAATGKALELTSKEYARYLGVTDQQYQETSRRVLTILEGKALTTKQLKKELQTNLNLSPILNLMCDQFMLIRGPPEKGWKTNIHTYYLFTEYFPDIDLNAYDESKAREHIVRKYITSFAPVTENDVSWWTGFPKRQITQIIDSSKDKIVRVQVSDMKEDFLIPSSYKATLLSTKPFSNPVVNILPSLDPYLMGYKDRDRYMNREHREFVFDRSGNATSTILLDGQVVGIWEPEEPCVKILLFREVEPTVLRKIHAEARITGTFISGRDTTAKQCSSMIPLTERTAGAVMSPLRGAN